MVKPLRF